MTPISLLTRSHTIREVSNRPGPYRPAKNTLPKFGNSRLAVVEPPRQGALFAAAEAAPAVEPVMEAPSPKAAPPTPTAKLEVASLKSEAKSATKPVNQPAEPVKEKAPSVRPAMREAGRGIWRLLLERITGERKKNTRPATVQTELALERVSVVRNDLSDDDLEVVPVARPGKTRRIEEAKEEAVGAVARE